jgi:hypothetical protein
MNYIRGLAESDTASSATPDERLRSLTAAAVSFLPRDKVEHQARQWLSGVPWIVHEGHWTVARTLATELALITPSTSGSTAFDRLLRSGKVRSPEDVTALGLLRRGRPYPARLTGDRFEDLTSGEKLILAPSEMIEGDGVVFGWFVKTSDGRAIATSVPLPLDDEALAVALGFRQPGGGLSSPTRCAEAVYRNVVRRGMAAPEPPEPEPEMPFAPDRDPLDALAAHWVALDGEPDAEERAKVRPFVGIGPLLNALISVFIARDGRAGRLATAYRRIAGQIIEFMALREAHGSTQLGLERAAAEVDTAVASGRCRPEIRALFNELREVARLAVGRRGGADADLDRLVQRIRALRAKTVEQGCTEQEALAAAEKVAELLDRHGLSLSELDLRRQRCEGVGVDTGRRRRAPIDDCMPTIAWFFNSRTWSELGADGEIRYIFFGMPADVQAAAYLYDLVTLAFARETILFQSAAFYRSLDSGARRSATHSFQVGLSRGIVGKLDSLRRARDAGASGGGGRALVPVKRSIIDEEMERLGLTLRAANAVRRKVIPDAFSAGKEAGARFEYRPGIAAE